MKISPVSQEYQGVTEMAVQSRKQRKLNSPVIYMGETPYPREFSTTGTFST